MIRYFYIDNFKSLMDFSLPPKPAPLSRFNCLVGMNGAGKSTVLQAFDFIKQLLHGRLDDWLKARDWKKSELTSRLGRKRVIIFKLSCETPSGLVKWEGQFNPSLLRCTSESVYCGESEILKFADGVAHYSPSDEKNPWLQAQGFNFQGSVLSALVIDSAHPALRSLRDFIRDLKSLDMLAPNLMRKRSRAEKDGDDMGYGGERLSSFLSGFYGSEKDNLIKVLIHFYAQVKEVNTPTLTGGWKDLRVVEKYNELSFALNAKQLNDGLLRILAIVSQIEAKNSDYPIQKEYRTFLFDEIENGIHPELIEKLVAYLLEAKQQIFVTTHNPMILNYLPDNVAQESVLLLYRTAAGATKCVRYFDLPTAKRKLALLGPGEVYVDTDLSSLIVEAESLRNPQA
jgi:predicted ATPase